MHNCADGVTGVGNKPAKAMFIGIAPGRTEWNKTRIPFTGPAGKLLRGTLKAVGYDLEDAYITNLICWWKDDPEIDEIEQCFPRLQREIEEVNPNLIVLLGAHACRWFLGKYKRGRLIYKDNRWYLPTHHPALFLHDQKYKFDIADFARDMSKVATVSEWNHGPPIVDYYVAQSADEAEAILWSVSGVTAIDVETSFDGKEFNYPDEHLCGNADSKLLCLSIANERGVWVIPGKYFIDIRPGWAERDNVQWLMHLGLFDKARIREILGEDIKISEDSLYQSYSLDERAGEATENERSVGVHGLKLLQAEFLGMPDYNVSVLQADYDELHKYNAIDAYGTYELYKYFRPRQDADNVREMYEKILIPGANILSEIQAYGAHIDVEFMAHLGAKWSEQWLQLFEELQDEARELGWPSDTEFNFNSPKHLARFLFDILELPLHRTFGRSSRKEVLEDYSPRVSWCDKFLQWRAINHMLNSYVVGVEDDLKYDGRIHSEPVLHGTRGGRLSYKKPPVQTIPKHGVDPDLAQIRKMFSATTDEYVIIEADLKQAEMWATAYLAEDEEMLHALSTGDAHAITTKDLIDIDESSPMWKPMRELGKLVNFGTLYNRTAKSYALNPWQGRKPPKGLEDFKWTQRQWQIFIDKWFEKYSKIRDWQRRQIREAFDTGEQVTKTGRKRRYWLPNRKTLNQSINLGPQSLAHDYLFDSLMKLHYLLKPFDAHIWYEVHDSLIIEANKHLLDNSIPLIGNIMSEPKFGLGGIPCDIGYGPNWLETEKVS